MKKINHFYLPHLIVFFLALPLITNAQTGDYIKNEFLVQLVRGLDGNIFSKRYAYFHGVSTGLSAKKQLSKQPNVWLLTYDESKVSKNAFKTFLSGKKEVKAIQLNHILTQREIIPNDPDFNLQWQWRNDGSSGGTVDADVDAELAWDISTGGLTALGDSIVVAVIDDGMDMAHPDLRDNLWKNYAEIPDNGIDDDNNGYIDDYDGWYPNQENDNIGTGNHGVKVSGMVGARGNNGTGVTGINWNIKIMFIKVHNPLTEDQIIAAYSYVLTQRQIYNETHGESGAFVVSTNASWGKSGWPDDAPIWCSFYDALGTAGILNVGATTNSDSNVDINGDLPTTCPSEYLVSVTMTDKNDAIAGAGYGITNIDVAAPGKAIYTTGNGGTYVTNSGTSYASPLTAGLIGLLYASPCGNLAEIAGNNPALAASTVRDFLYAGVDTLPQLIDSLATGGRINAFKSLSLTLDNCDACQTPYNLGVMNITSTTATLTWNLFSSGVASDIRWRYEGDTEWTTITGVSSPYELTGLSACHSVEFQAKSICTGENSEFTSSFTFQTDGCCIPPENIHTTGVNDEHATIAWTPLVAAIGYNLQIRAAGTSEWLTFASDGNIPAFELTNLTGCTEYETRVQTICEGTTTGFSPIYMFSTLGCGNCLEGDYCTSAGDNAAGEWIERIVFGDIDNTSGTDDGYGDFTGISTDLNAGETYDFSLYIGYDITHYNENIRVWIDYDKDGIFDPVEELATEPVVRKDTFHTQITIPEDLQSGATRMRVSLKWGQINPADISPCEHFNIGEVEDYCVNINVPDDIPTPVRNMSVNLSPNPVQDVLSLTFYENSMERASVSIFSFDGKKLLSFDKQILPERQTMSIQLPDDLPAGIYFVNIRTENTVFAKKFIKM